MIVGRKYTELELIDDWDGDIQFTSSAEQCLKYEFLSKATRSIYRRVLPHDVKQAFQNVATMWCAELNVGANERMHLLPVGVFDSQDLKITALMNEAAKISPAHREAMGILRGDIDAFYNLKTYIRAPFMLRLQGSEYVGGDCTPHADGATLLGARYAGPKTREYHPDDSSVVNGRAEIIEGARYADMEHGFIWGHRETPLINVLDRGVAVHQKGVVNGKEGLLLTAQV